MMAHHLRRQIREAAATALFGAGDWGVNVFTTRRTPVAAEHLPCALVYTTDETSERDTLGSDRQLRRELVLAIQAMIQDNDTLDDSLDGLAADVEAAMMADPTFGGLALDCALTRTQIDIRAGGANAEMKTGSVVLTFAVSYLTRADDPTAQQ
jgi:hypothetical protein